MTILILFVFSASCTGLKAVKEGEYLYNGAGLIIVDSLLKKKERHDLFVSLEKQIQPKKNRTFLWMRPALSIYAMVKEPKKQKGFKYWLKYKVGKSPVLLSAVDPDRVVTKFENQLFHSGWFNNQGKYEVTYAKKTARINYEVYTDHQYHLNTIKTLKDSLSIAADINKELYLSLLQRNQPYQLDQLSRERDRVRFSLLDKGYYFFKPEYFYYSAARDNVNHTVDLQPKLKLDAPSYAYEKYRIDNIYINDDYRNSQDYKPDTSSYEDVLMLSEYHDIRPKILRNEILLKQGEIYTREKHLKSIIRLNALRNYRFVNIQYQNEDHLRNTIDAHVVLIPQRKFSLITEFEGSVKTNNFAGPGLKLNFISRNVFNGAEMISAKISGRFDTQIQADQDPITSFEVSGELGLIIPRIVPVNQRTEDRMYSGSTRIFMSAGILRRVGLYTFFTNNLAYSYNWKKGNSITHMLKAIDISITNLSEASEEFLDFLSKNPSVRRSMERQYIFGLAYDFSYTNVMRKNFSYYGGVDMAGNLADLLTSDSNVDNEGSKQIFGVPFTQFVRLRNDIRYQFNVSKNSKIATRLIASMGIPYGNSKVMPYVRQFFVGGTNSVRAFPARSVGPGSYTPADSASNLLVDQSGDVKLEGNIEFRFPIAGKFKGAIFMDAGNIWLVNKDENRPGGQFQFEDFYKELAVGSGFGLRYDIDLLVVRFDWAFPLRVPSLPEGERWVFEGFNIFDSEWRKNNLILNISLGYPF